MISIDRGGMIGVTRSFSILNQAGMSPSMRHEEDQGIIMMALDSQLFCSDRPHKAQADPQNLQRPSKRRATAVRQTRHGAGDARRRTSVAEVGVKLGVCQSIAPSSVTMLRCRRGARKPLLVLSRLSWDLEHAPAWRQHDRRSKVNRQLPSNDRGPNRPLCQIMPLHRTGRFKRQWWQKRPPRCHERRLRIL